MRIAWFRHPLSEAGNPLDDSAPLIEALRATHDIDVIDEHNAHDFVWQHLIRPWDLCVYELDHSDAHRFIRGYLVNYPGVVHLRSTNVTMLGVALLASRASVISDEGIAERLRAGYPDANLRVAPPCSGASAAATHTNRLVTFAVFDERTGRDDVVGRALQRARDAGAAFAVLDRDEPSTVSSCDVVIAPAWPPHRHPATAVLAGMAAAKAVVTSEQEATAGWPAIDPQTWKPRGLSVTDAPIAVTVDPRDEEHSLMLAIRRLSTDADAREQLGAAGHAWWKTHATPAHAEAAWKQILEEAVRLSPPPRPADWPKEFARDGTELTRTILREFGLRSPG